MKSSERVLVLVRGVSERKVTVDLITREKLVGIGCQSVDHLCSLIAEGAGLVLVAEEMLDEAAVTCLAELVRDQPPWSDLPIVCFSGEYRQGVSHTLQTLGNVTFLERPIHVRSMLAAVQSGLRSRRRQYEARRAIESRDAFLAMLGHELRNPLAAISMASELVTAHELPPAAGPKFEVIHRQAQHLSHLVDELLDVARFTHGKVTIKRSLVDPLASARAAFEALRARAEEKGLRYEFVLPADVTCHIEGDAQRLEQVFSNLLNNAVKYTPQGGQISLHVRREPGWLVAEVSDSGVGLMPDFIDHAFDPFLQADSSLDRSEGGLGLGLSLVKTIVELHRGSVSAESAGAGKGSTFRLRLPLSLTASNEVASGSSAEKSAGVPPREVLVIEDNEDIRDLFTAMLERAGHYVSCAGDGPEGLAQLVRRPPDVAFVDIGLPGFDGLELARRARGIGSTVFLVALTGYGQAEDRKRTAAVGFDEHLVKPVLEADVESVLAKAARRVSELHSAVIVDRTASTG